MSSLGLFICGIIVTLLTGMGVITSQVFLGYHSVNDSMDDYVEEFEGDYL